MKVSRKRNVTFAYVNFLFYNNKNSETAIFVLSIYGDPDETFHHDFYCFIVVKIKLKLRTFVFVRACRSSHQSRSKIKSVLKNFVIFTEKHLCWSHIKKRLQQKCFLENIAKFLRASLLENICERLLLPIIIAIIIGIILLEQNYRTLK